MADHREQLVDELLVMDAQSGRVKAMEMLVCRWQKRLWCYACRLTGSPEAAWDVTQESWLGIVRGISRLSDPARFRPWAYRIVTNKANDWLRRKARRSQIQADRDINRQQQHSDRPPDEMATHIETILRQIPERSRTVLTLHYLEGLPLVEVARVLGTAQGTVKSRLHTARLEFRQLWESLADAWQTETSAYEKGDVKWTNRSSE
jgi:RNA polymerase sigma-70 factor (ECF subfamily)